MDNNLMQNMTEDIKKNINKNENIVITYDNIITIKEIGLVNYLLSNFDYYNKFFYLDIFNKYKKEAIIRILVDRKEKDFIKLFLRDSKYENRMKKELSDKINYTTSTEYPSNFAIGILKYILAKNVSKVVILIDEKDKKGLEFLYNLYNEYTDIIYIVNKTNKNIKKYFLDPDYKLIFTDETDILFSIKDKLIGKTICIPYTGYNFKIEKQNNMEMLISNQKWEFVSIVNKFNIGFIDIYKITKNMFELKK